MCILETRQQILLVLNKYGVDNVDLSDLHIAPTIDRVR
jgi:hypothetical protein